jgi:hypothetical protein
MQHVAALAMKRGKSLDFTGYWRRHMVRSGPRQFVMIDRKPLAEIAVYSVAMPATVGLCLWVLLGPLRIDRYLGVPIPGLTNADSVAATTAPVGAPVPADKEEPETATTVVGEPETAATVVLFPGDDGRLLAQMQGALIRKGYSVGTAGADANDNTLTALEAFQDDKALPVQPKCDPQCRTALGLPDPQ